MRKGRHFRCELMWETHPDFIQTLPHNWQEAGEATILTDLKWKSAVVASGIDGWGSKSFGHIGRELNQLHKALDHLQSDPPHTGPIYEEVKIREHIMELNHMEEIMWRQRSRIMWLAEGDKNTKFFHLQASQRRKKTMITMLKKT